MRRVAMLVVLAMTARLADAGRGVSLVPTERACPLDDAIAGAAAILGYNPLRASDDRYDLEVEVIEEESGFRAQLLLHDRSGSTRGPRTVRAASCDALQSALAVVVATILQRR